MDKAQLGREIDSEFMPLDELRRELENLERGDFASLSDDELREKIRKIHNGFTIQCPVLPAGTAIFRAVRVYRRPANRGEVSYPPAKIVGKSGRCNRAGEVMFYGALNQFLSCLQECSWKIGELFAVSVWITTEPMLFNHLGYSNEVLRGFKAVRDLPYFANISNDSDRNVLIREWQGRVFTQKVESGLEDLYRLPIMLKEAALWNIGQPHPGAPDLISGVIYPSLAMWALGDNVAILPSEVDRKMALAEVILLTLDSTKLVTKDDGGSETQMQLKNYDHARERSDGTLVWGQVSQVIYPKGVDASNKRIRILRPDFNPSNDENVTTGQGAAS